MRVVYVGACSRRIILKDMGVPRRIEHQLIVRGESALASDCLEFERATAVSGPVDCVSPRKRQRGRDTCDTVDILIAARDIPSAIR